MMSLRNFLSRMHARPASIRWLRSSASRSCARSRVGHPRKPVAMAPRAHTSAHIHAMHEELALILILLAFGTKIASNTVEHMSG